MAREYAQARGVVLPTLEELKPVVEERLRDLETMLRADVSKGRLAVGALLGDTRLRVHPDGRIEGTATLSPNESRRPQTAPGRRVSVVAGARYARVCALPVALELPVSGQVV